MGGGKLCCLRRNTTILYVGLILVSLFHSYKRLIDIDRAQVDSLRKHGIKTCQIMDYMMDQKGGLVGASLHKHGVKTSQIMNYMMDQKGGLVGAGFIKKGFVQLY